MTTPPGPGARGDAPAGPHPAPTPWAAPVAAGPVRAAVRVSGSKSETNRALVLAALADGPSVVRAPLRSRDTALMAAALRALGADVADVADGPDGSWRVTPPDGLTGDADVDCGLAGTVMRFVPPIAALATGDVRFDGDARARERPMGAVLDALRGLGARVDGDALPFAIRGRGGIAGGDVTIDASASSQFVSGLLLAGARFDRGVTVRHEGGPLPSRPHVDMTVAMLREHGVIVAELSDTVWHVEPGSITARDRDVEPDLSNASAYLAAAAATGGTVTVPGWPKETTQPGDAIRALLADLGCVVEHTADGLTVTGPPRPDGVATGARVTGLAGIDADLGGVGELAPTVAALAALATTPSRLRGIAHLRGHETDRLAALAAELTGLGGDVVETADGLVITPRPLRGGPWRAYADHRMATAGAIVGLVVPGVVVDDVACTAKTIPDFPATWAAVLS